MTTGKEVQSKEGVELAPTAAAAEKQFEIQSIITIAKKFPRNEEMAFSKLIKACKRKAFAEDAAYSFPRGGATVTGPSVNLAREAARVWTNIRHGLYVIREDENTRLIRGWAWDVETNTAVQAEDEFKKLIYRKAKDGKPAGWYEPDERDLRELTNRRGAILVRNCILQLLPKDLIEDAQDECRVTLEKKAKEDPDDARKQAIIAFAEYNITPEMLEVYLKHPLGESTPKELAQLRTIYRSIADGNSKWSDYVGTKEPASDPGADTLKSVQDKLAKTDDPVKEPEAPEPPDPYADEDAWRQACFEMEEKKTAAFNAAKKVFKIKTALLLKGPQRQKFVEAVTKQEAKKA